MHRFSVAPVSEATLRVHPHDAQKHNAPALIRGGGARRHIGGYPGESLNIHTPAGVVQTVSPCSDAA